MEVGHQLSRVRPAVDGQPVAAFGDSLFSGKLIGDPYHFADERRIFIRHVRQRCDVLYGQDEYMHRRYRVDIREGKYLVIAVEDFGRYLSRGDFAKNAVGLTFSGTHGSNL